MRTGERYESSCSWNPGDETADMDCSPVEQEKVSGSAQGSRLMPVSSAGLSKAAGSRYTAKAGKESSRGNRPNYRMRVLERQKQTLSRRQTFAAARSEGSLTAAIRCQQCEAGPSPEHGHPGDVGELPGNGRQHAQIPEAVASWEEIGTLCCIAALRV